MTGGTPPDNAATAAPSPTTDNALPGGDGGGGSNQAQELTQEQIAQISAIPLPPEVEQLISRSRGEFFAAVGQAWEASIKPLTFTVKLIQVQAAQAQQMRAAAAVPEEVAKRRDATRAKVEARKAAADKGNRRERRSGAGATRK